MTRIKIVCFLALVSALGAQLPIPSWAQWLSDDEKSWQVFTTIAGCEYEEIDIGSLDYVKQGLIESYLRGGVEFTEEDLDGAQERYWKTATKDYPLQHIQDGYKMIKIIDASAASDEARDWGKVVVWEWYFTVKNTSPSKLRVSVEYNLTEENIIFTKATDGMYFYLESGETGTYYSTDYFPIDYLEEIENRTWSISYDY